MRNLRLLSPLLRQLMPGLEVKDVLAELHERVVEECDYELEASNHRRVERLRRGHPFIRVPAVDTELSRRRVLVADWVDGIASIDVTRQPDTMGLGVALGDPPPGNNLLRADGQTREQPDSRPSLSLPHQERTSPTALVSPMQRTSSGSPSPG